MLERAQQFCLHVSIFLSLYENELTLDTDVAVRVLFSRIGIGFTVIFLLF